MENLKTMATFQKVISVNIAVSNIDLDIGFEELDFPTLNAALEEGFQIKSTISPNTIEKGVFNITFILIKGGD